MPPMSNSMKISKNNQVSFRVEEEHGGMLLREYLLTSKQISSKSLCKLKNNGEILCNGQLVTVRKLIQVGDEITLNYPEETISQYLTPQYIPLDILWEDRDVAVINKQPGMCVHPTKGHPNGTLANGLLFHMEQQGEPGTFHAVNRLDQDTSGVVLVAKNSYTKQQLFIQQQQQQIKRTYIALVHGELSEAETINKPIRKIEGKTTKREVHTLGQPAITHYQTIQTGNGYSLIGLWLETGRTHQIRVHMESIGHPLVGDVLYGGLEHFISRQALHATRIEFTHPRFDEKVSVIAPLAQDMLNAAKELLGSETRIR